MLRRACVLAAGVLVTGVWLLDPWSLFRAKSPEQFTVAAGTKPISMVFLLRHAEKDGECLSPEGKERARRLAEVFKYTKIHHLVASRLCRTKQTLEPLAALKKINPKDIAEVGDLEESSAEDVVRLLRTFPPGEVSVVVHHSTTVQRIAQDLGIPAADARAIDLNAHDCLSLILIPGEGAPQLVQLAYK